MHARLAWRAAGFQIRRDPVSLSSFVTQGADRIRRGGFQGLGADGEPGDDEREASRENEPPQLAGEINPRKRF